jgi:hypothetical protein
MLAWHLAYIETNVLVCSSKVLPQAARHALSTIWCWMGGWRGLRSEYEQTAQWFQQGMNGARFGGGCHAPSESLAFQGWQWRRPRALYSSMEALS